MGWHLHVLPWLYVVSGRTRPLFFSCPPVDKIRLMYLDVQQYSATNPIAFRKSRSAS